MNDLTKRFLNYLTVEKGLSENTMRAYKNDLNKFYSFLEESGTDISRITKNDLTSHLNRLRDRGSQTPTIARNISSLRGLCRFMLSEGMISEDPMENFSTPKGWKHLPGVLRVDEVVSLIEKPRGGKFSLRDKALLELLYSSGLRASEIIGLKVKDINFEAGFIIVMGKGSRERVVPMNERAMRSLKKYMTELRPRLHRRKTVQNFFLAKAGRPLTRQRLWQLIKSYSSELSLK
ncbi:MAG TPA: site-specific tyrosine recombinase XerD, partial [Nitrospirae bacterium]|nr:site-specific tyrosine recombinase XerD [Nitrospirota bacterium]